ncbi:MAG TPA: hypothetical protein VIL30_26580 [Ramlibacter sp.]|jgi:hypothetical protein
MADPCGTIRYVATHADGSLAGCGTTSTFHPGDELHVMSGALELERASKRGVRIPPHALGSLIVMAPDAPFWTVVRTWWRERRRALTARKKWQDWLSAEKVKEAAHG